VKRALHQIKPKETIRQTDNKHYDSHTNPCTIYVRISYQHQLSVI